MSNTKNELENEVIEPKTEIKAEVLSDERYEKKGFWGTISRALMNFWLDLKSSFVYNQMKLPAILIGIPGVLLGFFITFHRAVIMQIAFFAAEENYTNFIAGGNTVDLPVIYSSQDLSAICFFVLMLLGILNLFTAAGISGRKNLGSVVTATVSTALMVIFAGIYLFFIIMSIMYSQNGYVNMSEGGVIVGSIDFIMVMISCGVSIISSIVGCILGFLRYDRTYKKSDSR